MAWVVGGSCLRGFVGTGRGGFPLRHPSRPLHLGHSNPKAEVCEAPLGPEGVLGLRPRPSLPTTPKPCAGEGLFIYFKGARCAPAYLEMTSREPLWPHQTAPLSSLGIKTRLPKGRARGHDSAARCERRSDCGRTPQATQPDVPGTVCPPCFRSGPSASDSLSDAHLAEWGRGRGLPPVLYFGREPHAAPRLRL